MATSPASISQRTTLHLGDLTIAIQHKPIKNLHLSVNPPAGHIRISAPLNTTPDTIRLFAIAKLPWITQQQRKLQAQARQAPRQYIPRESHYLWGQRYLLEICETPACKTLACKNTAKPRVEITPRKLRLHLPPNSTQLQRQALLERTYRQQLKQAIPPLIAKWERLMGVNITGFTIRKMKTKWGSCSPNLRTIRLNLALAQKPREYLEYVLIHEMTHLLEPTHNKRFISLLDQFMPQWRCYRDELNRLPLSHQPWPDSPNSL